MARDVIVFDFTLVRGMWETRVKKYRERRKKENERLEKSSLEKIKQEWNFILECKKKGIPQAVYAKNGFIDTSLKLLDKLEANSPLFKESNFSEESRKERNKFIFELFGEDWKELPETLREQTHLKEWHINNTQIAIIPSYIEMFQELRVLEMSQNLITHLPPEIGCLKNLKELNVSFNKLQSIPPDLGNCENLEKMDLSGNLDLMELPFELSNLKQLKFVDVSANKFSTIPVCVLRMSNLQWLDISSNNLKDLPEDMDRLDELHTLLLHKNKITYLPWALTKMPKLSLLVVSGDKLVEIPTAVLESSTLKYINLHDSPLQGLFPSETKEVEDRDYEKFEKEFMKAYIEDLKEREMVPRYTQKVSFSVQL
ncbi:leucine-rich repeat-containing protein 2 [Microcaecilia unicolor]|uniref:Leucine-rich repeat-containing protein 2 n=1 Tax=Microcaecilia unicolor TaxID=1415580 RepID=A0A6P7XFR1_9AMPH|nr:leucine-rich repeat-containing protein 2 [Microcaecilia unicolor]